MTEQTDVAKPIDHNSFCKPPHWRWWKRIRAHDQNVTADIEVARVAICNLLCYKYDDHGARVLISCQEMISQCIASQQRLFSNRIFVRETLFLIMQNIILIMPRENLPAVWLSVRQRLGAIDASESAEYQKSNTLAEIDTYMQQLSTKKQGDLDTPDTIVRQKIKEIKSFVDEKVITELWSGMVLQRQTYILGTIVLFSLLSTILTHLYETCRWPWLDCANKAQRRRGLALCQ
jgi:hypothetical protein